MIEEEEEEEEPRSKEMGPQVVSTQQVTTPTKPAKGQGIRKAKEIEGESKKIEHGGRKLYYNSHEFSCHEHRYRGHLSIETDSL